MAHRSNKATSRRELQKSLQHENQMKTVHCLSAVLPLILAGIQLHGVLLVLLMKQPNNVQLAYKQLLSEWRTNCKKVRALKRLKTGPKRRRWINPGRTDKWWLNLLNGILSDEE